MKLPSKQHMLTSLTVALMSGALVTGTTLAQGVGTSAPSAGTSAPSAGTSAPSTGTSAPSTGTSAPSPIQPSVGRGNRGRAEPDRQRDALADTAVADESGGWHRDNGRRRAEQAGNPRDGI